MEVHLEASPRIPRCLTPIYTEIGARKIRKNTNLAWGGWPQHQSPPPSTHRAFGGAFRRLWRGLGGKPLGLCLQGASRGLNLLKFGPYSFP